jgi:hypothetical protein
MKRSWIGSGFILGMAAMASAVLLSEGAFGQHVYSLNICTGPIPMSSVIYTSDHQWGMDSSTGWFYGVTQGHQCRLDGKEPTTYSTTIWFGEHTLIMRMPECLLVNRRRLVIGSSALLATSGLASLVYFRRSRQAISGSNRNC